MKVLILSQHFYPENFRFNDLAKGLVTEGHEVTVLTGIPNYPQGDFYKGYSLFSPRKETWEGMTIIRSPLIPRKQTKIFLALNYISFPIFATIYWFILRLSQRFDRVLICQSSPIFMAIPAVIVRRFFKTPVYLWITDLWPESLRATNTFKSPFILKPIEWITKMIYLGVDHILISCKGFRLSIEEKIGVNRRPISYFPYWAEDFYQPLEEDKIEVTEDEKKLFQSEGLKLVFAGNLGEAQNLELIIDAVSMRGKDDLKVIFIGNGRARKGLEKKVADLNLSGKVFFLGQKPIQKMNDYFALADVLYISLREDPIFSITVPSKLQSYLAVRKPILASISGEAADLIVESNSGLVSSANNAEELFRNIDRLCAMSQGDLRNYAENGYNYFKKHFKRGIVFEKLEQLLKCR